MALTFITTVISVPALMDARSVPIDDAWVTNLHVSLLFTRSSRINNCSSVNQFFLFIDNCSDCSGDYSPVCTVDGRTLPNSCFAK